MLNVWNPFYDNYCICTQDMDSIDIFSKLADCHLANDWTSFVKHKLQYPSDEWSALADLGGRAGHMPPPMGPNSFIFAYIFTKKHPHQRSTPPNGCTPPYRKSLIRHWSALIFTVIQFRIHLHFELQTGIQKLLFISGKC